MSYSGNIGPINRPPPWRQYGFRSFQGLGFDRLAEKATHTFVFSITAVRGLPTGGWAPHVPSRIVRYLGNYGFSDPQAGWASGGRVWGRYMVDAGGSLVRDEALRRGKLRKALEAAARSIGPTVSFEVAGLGRIPAEAPSAAPVSAGAEQTAPSSGEDATTVNVRELQQLLASKGFNPGAIDGIWGPHTAGALLQAARAAGQPLADGTAVGTDDRRGVRVPSGTMSAISALPARAPSSSVAAPAAALTMPDIAPLTSGGLPDWLPWTLGAVGVAAAGGYFIWKGKKRRRVRRNRRRRVSRRGVR